MVAAAPADMGGRALRLLLLVGGLVALSIAVWQAYATLHLLHKGARADGHIAAASDPTAELAHPVVRFRTVGGAEIQYRQNGYSASRGQDKVRVLYDPADPAATAIVQSFSTLWLPVVMPLAIGAAALALAIGSFVLSGRAA